MDRYKTAGRLFDSLNERAVGPFDDQPKGVMTCTIASFRWLADSLVTEIGMKYGR